MAGTSTAALTQTMVTMRRSRTLRPGRLQTPPGPYSRPSRSNAVRVSGASVIITWANRSSDMVILSKDAGDPHSFECGIRRGEQDRVGQPGVGGQDPDVLREERSGAGGHRVEVEAAATDDVGGEAATAAGREDVGDRCLVEASGGRHFEDFRGECELGGEECVVEQLGLFAGTEG